MMTPDEQSFTLPVTFGPMTDELRDFLFPPAPPTLGTIDAEWPCKWCDAKIPMRSEITSTERLDNSRRMHATVVDEDAATMREHVVGHGIDPGPVVPLEILVEVAL